jgi:hypothetical protein
MRRTTTASATAWPHIPPFTGDGLAIALGSAVLAVVAIWRNLPPTLISRRLAAKPIRLASAVAGLARNQAGRVLLLGAEAYLPGLTAAVVRHTRLPLAARHLTVPASRESPGAGLPMMDQDVS